MRMLTDLLRSSHIESSSATSAQCAENLLKETILEHLGRADQIRVRHPLNVRGDATSKSERWEHRQAGQTGAHIFRSDRTGKDCFVEHRTLLENTGEIPGSLQSTNQLLQLRDVLTGKCSESRLAHAAKIHGRRQCIERMVRADVGRRLLTPNILFASSQRHDKCLATLRVDGLTDDSTGEVTVVLLQGGKDAKMRPTK